MSTRTRRSWWHRLTPGTDDRGDICLARRAGCKGEWFIREGRQEDGDLRPCVQRVLLTLTEIDALHEMAHKEATHASQVPQE